MKLRAGSLPLLFLTIAILIAAASVTVNAGPGGSVHNLNKVTDYTTIAAAIADANEGDTIQVDSGTYAEYNIYIEKYIRLTGNGPTKPVIDCGENNGIIVEADGVSITGINVTDSEQGITLHGGYASIADCNISDSTRGIFIGYGSSDNEISNCNITGCSNAGIYLNYADDNNLHNNNITGCGDAGIWLYYSGDNVFRNNNLTLSSNGLIFEEADYNEIVGNNISGNTYRGLRFRNGGSYNDIYQNIFIGNTKDVDYNEDNYWNSGEPLSYQYHGVTYTNRTGNYWASYTGLDSNNDGIGDTPKVVFYGDGSNIYDNYPMMLDLPVPPKASFTLNATCNYAPFAVKFTDMSAGFPTSWHWVFGDGATADVQNPVHIYSTPGTYLVNLTATNAFGSNTAKMEDTGKLILGLNPLPSPLKAEWLKTYPMSGVSGAYSYSVVGASDDGFAMAGYTTGANSGLRLTRTDADGGQVWNQRYTTEGFGLAVGMLPEEDGGFTFAGEDPAGLLIVTRTKADGSVAWTTTLPNTNGNHPDIAHTSDGGYIVLGTRTFLISGDQYQRVCLTKLDAGGSFVWEKIHGDFITWIDYRNVYSSCAAGDVQETPDGGYIIAGALDLIGRGSDFYLLKTDSSGNFQWNATYGVLGNGESGTAILQTGDGGYLVAGSAVTYDEDDDPVSNVLLVKVSSGGSITGTSMYRGSDDQRIGTSMIPADGGAIVAGYALTEDGYYRPYLLGVDESGNRNWEAILNFTLSEHLAIAPAGDGFVITGSTRASDEADYEAFMMKISTAGKPVHNTRTLVDYGTISEAITAAEAGDIIVADSGTYTEHVSIDKALTLTGRNTGAGMPKIDAGGYDYAIYVGADGATVSGFNVTNAEFGIEIGASHAKVTGNMAVRCSDYGIMLDTSTMYNNVTYNTIKDCTSGIMLSGDTSRNNVTGNVATGNDYGIRAYYSGGTIPTYNNIAGNNFSLNEVGIRVQNVYYNNITGNTILGCTGTGIELTSSGYDNVSCNVIANDYAGIYTYSSYENTFAGNTISGNTNGICLEGSNGVLSGNVLSGNNVGIYLKYCTNSVLWLNRLSNTLNFKIDGTGTNYWNSSITMGYYYNGHHFVSHIGNYWSDYSGTDSNSNGIIDTARQLASGNADRYPVLMGFPSIVTPEVPAYPVRNVRTGLGYDTISAAIVVAQAGDTILADSGTYRENVVVNKTLNLTGIDKGSGKPVVDGLKGVAAISITANNAVVRGFTATGATTGIDIWGVNATVKDNNASGNIYFGIYAEYESKLNNITGNTVSGNLNGLGIGIAGISGMGPAYNNVSGNTVYGNGGSGGIECGQCSNNTISNNVVTDNQLRGIYLSYSSNNTIAGNTVRGNTYGGILLFQNCNNNTIAGNNVSLNGNDYNSHTGGIILNTQCNYNRITANNASYNPCNGIYFQNANKGNVMWLNVLKGNYQNAFVEYAAGYTNSWSSGTPIEYTYNSHVYTNYAGNFWGDYTGVDSTGDGIGDTPYETGSLTDNYPMTTTSVLAQPVCNLRTGQRYDTISAAIAEALSGDTITVNSGTYAESVAINKKINLTGIDTGNGRPLVSPVSAGGMRLMTPGITVQGFDVRTPGIGIIVEASDTTLGFINVSFAGSQVGVWLHGAAFLNNTTLSHVNSSCNSGLEETDGFLLQDTTNTVITDCVAVNNRDDGFFLLNSNFVNISRCNASYNAVDGIGLYNSSYCQITETTFMNNSQSGAYFDPSSHNINVSWNDFRYNLAKNVWICSSSSRLVFYRNNFTQTTGVYNVYNMGMLNKFNSTQPLTYLYNGQEFTNYIGNNWSTYTGYDENGDGIGETPYVSSGVTDYCPLTSRSRLPVPVIEFSAASATANEGTIAHITLTRTGAVNTEASVTVTATGGTADGSDSTMADTIVTFAPGSTSQTFDMYVIDDHLTEGSETLILGLSYLSGATAGTVAEYTLTIADTSLSSPSIAFAATGVTANEGTTPHIMLHRSGDTTDYSYVKVSYIGGTAIRGVNYTFTNVTITFEPGQSDSGFDVGLPSNSVREPVDTYVNFSLSDPSNAVLGSQTMCNLTIHDATVLSKQVCNLRTGQRYDTISAAIAEALSGDTITVNSGTYAESVAINKKINLTGIDTGNGRPLVSPVSGGGMRLMTPGIMVQGFDVRAGIGILVEASDSTLSFINVSFAGSQVGVYVHGAAFLNNTTLSHVNSSCNSGLEETDGFLLQDTTNTVITDCVANNNRDDGFFLLNSNFVNISRCNASYNAVDGIGLYNSSYCQITETTFMNNSKNGAYFDPSSHDNTISWNDFRYNLAKNVWINSGRQVFYRNNFIQATGVYNVYNMGSFNKFNSTRPLAYLYNGQAFTNYTGNYWSTYTGYDENGDGIGETPYVSGGVTDYYPLISVSGPPVQEIGFSAASAIANEGTTAHIMLYRTGDAKGYSYVRVSYIGGTAIRGVNYTFTNVTLTFEPGQAVSGFDVALPSDNVIEPKDVYVNFSISNPINAVLGGHTKCNLTIRDTTPQPAIQFAAATGSSDEGTIAHITLTRTGAVNAEASVVVTATGGTADGSDSTMADTIVTFDTGSTSQTFDMYVIDDHLTEGSETLVLGLSTYAGAAAGTPATYTLTIVDTSLSPPAIEFTASAGTGNEGATMHIMMYRSGDTSIESSVLVTDIGGTAARGKNYTFTPVRITFEAGQQYSGFDVKLLSNAVNEPVDTYVNFSLSDPISATLGDIVKFNLTIHDATLPTVVSTYPVNDTAGCIAGTIPAVKFSKPMTNVTFQLKDTYSNVVAGTALVDGANFTCMPSVPLKYGERYWATVLDATDGDGRHIAAPCAFTFVTGPAPVLNFSAASASVNEGSGYELFVIRTGDTSGVSTCFVEGGNGMAGYGDYSSSPTLPKSFTFGAGEARKSINFSTVADNLTEGSESVSYGIDYVNGGTRVTPYSFTLSISDTSRTPDTISFTKPGYTAFAGTTTQILVKRTGNKQPSAMIQIGGNAVEGRDFSVSKKQVNITYIDYDDFTVTVSANVTGMDKYVNFTLTDIIGADYSYQSTFNLTLAGASYIPKIQFASASGRIEEGGAQTFTITRTGLLNVDSQYQVYGNGTADWHDYTSSPSLGGWLTMTPGVSSQEITIYGTQDYQTEGTETALFWLVPRSNIAIGSQSTYTLTFNDTTTNFTKPIRNTRTWTVYTNLTKAISEAAKGDTIQVDSGTYNVNSLDLNGTSLAGRDTGRGRPLIVTSGTSNLINGSIDGVDFDSSGISTVYADSVLQVDGAWATVKNCNINSSGMCIYMYGYNGDDGLRLTIENCTLVGGGHNSFNYNIGSQATGSTIIRNSTFSGAGIRFSWAHNVMIDRCVLSGVSLVMSGTVGNTIRDSRIIGGEIQLLGGRTTVISNVVSQHSPGIGLLADGTYDLWVTGLSVSDPATGIKLADVDRNATIADSVIARAGSDGLLLDNSEHLTVINNSVIDCTTGVRLLEGSGNNTFYLNQFASVTNAVQVNTTNMWSSFAQLTYQYAGKTFTGNVGNKWNNYPGTDANGDGIGDTPYFSGTIRDSYPLARGAVISFTDNGPRVTSVYWGWSSPENFQVDDWIQFYLDRDVRESAFSGISLKDSSNRNVPVDIHYINDFYGNSWEYRIVVDPVSNLNYGETYTITIAGLVDLAGRTMATPYVATFKTQSNTLAVVSVSPPDGWPEVHSAYGSFVYNPIRIEFNRPIETITKDDVTAGKIRLLDESLQPAYITVAGYGKTLEIRPSTNLKNTTVYTIEINGLLDENGNAMAGKFQSRFITWGNPKAVATLPLDKATNVPVNQPVFVYFDKPLNPGTINSIAIKDSSGSKVSTSVGYLPYGSGKGDGSVSSVLIGHNNFSYSADYTIEITGVADIPGNSMKYVTRTTFRTADQPYIGSVSPAGAAIDVPRATTIKATFSKDMDSTSITSGFTLRDAGGNNVAGSVTYDAATRTATFRPTSLLAYGALYSAHVAGARDTAGNSITGFNWGFTTIRAPISVLSVSPASGAMDQPTSTVITATFSDEMDEWTVVHGFSVIEFNGGNVSGTVTYDAATRKATFLPSSQLNANGNMYTVRLSGMVGTHSGLMSDYTWNFRTLWRKPTVTSTSPVSGASGVSPNATITVTFSESMDPESLRTGFKLRDNLNNNLAGSVTVSGGTATFTPSAPMNEGEHYTVFLLGLKGIQKNTMPDYAFEFTVMHSMGSIPTSVPGGTFRPSLIPTATPTPFQTTLNGVGVTISGDRITAPTGTDISRFLTNGGVTIPAGSGKLTLDIDVGSPKNTGTITGVRVSDRSTGTANSGPATVSVTADLDGLPSGGVTFSVTVSDPTPADISAAREWTGSRSRSLVNALALIDVEKSGFTNDDIVDGTAKITLTVKKPADFSRTKTYTVIRHGDNGYEELTATYKSETADTVTFEILSPNGFSTFMLVETAAAATPTALVPPVSATPVPGPGLLLAALAFVTCAIIKVRVRKT